MCAYKVLTHFAGNQVVAGTLADINVHMCYCVRFLPSSCARKTNRLFTVYDQFHNRVRKKIGLTHSNVMYANVQALLAFYNCEHS